MVRKSEFLIALLLIIFGLAGSLAAGEIHETAKVGDIDKIKAIIANDLTRLWAQDKFGYTALHWATAREQWETVKYLVAEGANVNSYDLEGNTPLHCAAYHANVAIVGLFIKNYAVVDQRNIAGETPLHISCRSGNRKVAQILIFQGADVNAVSEAGYTPLHYAQLGGHAELAAQLRRSDASLEIEDKEGNTAEKYKFRRPKAKELDPSAFKDYFGKYSDSGKSLWSLLKIDDQLILQHFANHQIYSIGVDSFYCVKQPWLVTFSRKANGEIGEINIKQLQKKIAAKKVANTFELKDPDTEAGLIIEPLLKTELTSTALKNIYRLDAPTDTIGAKISFVLENSPADKAGIVQRDAVLMANGRQIMHPKELKKSIDEAQPGSALQLEVYRRGQLRSSTIIL